MRGSLRAQALDGAGQRKLGAPEPLDEVAAAGDAKRLELRQLGVDRREAAGDPLGQDLLAREYAVPFEQQLGQRPPTRARINTRREQRRRQRPPALDLGGRSDAPPSGEAPRAAPGRPRPIALGACECQPRRPQRRERVVGRLARPHEVPQSLLQLLGRELDVHQQVGEEARAGGESFADRGVLRQIGVAGGRAAKLRRPELGQVLAEVQGDSPGAAPQRTRPDPHDLTGGAELIDPRRRVGADPARQHVALPGVGGQRKPLQRHQRLAQPVDPGAGCGVAIDVLPCRQEPGQRTVVDRLDLLAEHRQRRPAQPPQHLGITPLALGSARPQLASHEHTLALELVATRRSGRPRSAPAARRP